MPNFTAGTTFGANDTVTNTKLNALIANAVINPECALSVNSGTISTLSCTRGTVPTFSSTTGTITGFNSTNGTVATLNSTTGTITGLNTTTGTIQTLTSSTLNSTLTGGTYSGLINSSTGTYSGLINSSTGTYSGLINSSTGTYSGSIGTARSLTAGTVTTLNSTTGTITGLNTTTGTIAGLTSTNGTVATLNSTTGTITTLNSTTPTFLGAITASTNTINVGSGQIYKDATGNVGIGTTTPNSVLDIGSHADGRGVSWSGINNIYSSYSGAATVVGTNIAPNLASDFGYLAGVTGTYGASGARLNLNGIVQVFTDTAAAKTAGLAFTPTERLRVDASGNVSIGTTTGLSKLHVHGDLTMSNATTAVTASTSTITPPATVAGYLTVSINGTSRKIPYYAT
jgi:trimeric autotransporter adhesin